MAGILLLGCVAPGGQTSAEGDGSLGALRPWRRWVSLVVTLAERARGRRPGSPRPPVHCAYRGASVTAADLARRGTGVRGCPTGSVPRASFWPGELGCVQWFSSSASSLRGPARAGSRAATLPCCRLTLVAGAEAVPAAIGCPGRRAAAGGRRVTDTMWDLAIVGAGPAGSTAALAALAERPRARVLLLDRERFPRDKSCGDGIAPHVLDVLGPLGAGDVIAGWTSLQQLELSRGRRTVCGRMARPVWVIPREVFDARLVDRAVAAGAHLVQHRVRVVRVEAGCMVLDGRFRARVVVAADGDGSAVRSALAGRWRGRRAIALRGYAPTAPNRAHRQVIRFEGRPHRRTLGLRRGEAGPRRYGEGGTTDTGLATTAARSAGAPATRHSRARGRWRGNNYRSRVGCGRAARGPCCTT